MTQNRIQPFILLLVVLVLFSVLPAMAQETTPDPQPTPETTANVVVTEITPSPTGVVTAEPTAEPVTPTPTSTATDEVIVIDSPEATAEVTDSPELTPEVTPDAEITEEPGVVVIPPAGEEVVEEDPLSSVQRSNPTTSTLPQIPTTGDVTVIVGLNMNRGRSGGGSGGSSELGMAFTHSAIQQAQEALAVNMRQFNANIITRFSEFPAMGMTVNQSGLAYLRSSNLVQYIQPVEYRQRAMNTSLDVIGVTTGGGANLNITETGVTDGGPGWVVAVIDGMPFYNHNFLQGRTVSPMCWNSGNGVTTTTPGTVACPYDGHGTHVAGTIAGGGSVQLQSLPSGNRLNGVARQARIMPLGVFNGENASDLDILAALNYVYSQRNNYPIAAVNMSLGGGRFTSVCNASYPAYYNIAALLRGAGIAVVAASGNDAYSTAMSAPACVSNIISVGATNDNDTVPTFTNYASFLDLMAPGNVIYSSTINDADNNPNTVTNPNPNNNLYGALNGTSMASPHVAGTFALMRQASPTASVDSMLALLKQYGTTVSDQPNTNLTWRRINVDDVLGQVYRLNSPNVSSTVRYRAPSFTWGAADNATFYELIVVDVTNPAAPLTVLQKWFQPGVSPEITCTTTCTVNLATDMNMGSGGSVQWYVRAYNPTYGYDPYMGPQNFTLSALTSSSPTGNPISPQTGLMTYSWTGIADASHYQIYVANSAGVGIINEWVTSGNALCGGGGTCTFTPTTPVANGLNTWYVRAFKANTYGPWSVGRTFTLAVQAPAIPTLSNPTSLSTPRPLLSFSGTAGSTAFEVYIVKESAPGVTVMYQSYTRTQACGSPTGTSCNLVQLNVDLLANETYNYYVRAYGAGGWSNWSAPYSFMLAVPVPPLPTNLTQNAVAQRGYNPTFTWSEANENATYYELIIYTQGWATAVHQVWYQRGNSIMTCNSGTCSVTPSLILTNQNYEWGVRAYNAAGFSTGGTGGYALSTINLSGMTAPNAANFLPGGWQVFNVATINIDDPIFQFNDIANANYYELYINNSVGTVLHQMWYPRTGNCNAGTCTVSPANLYLATNGTYGFYVRAYGPAGLSVGGPYGNGYAGETFTVATANIANERPETLTRVTAADDNTPTLRWVEVTDGTWYRVYITNASTGAVVLDQWRHYTSMNCGSISTSTTCSWVDAVNLTNGTYNWYVQGYSPAGYSLWSDSDLNTTALEPNTFTIAVPAPDAATLTAPTNGTIDDDGIVTFTWNLASNATAYYLQVYPTGSLVNTFGQWFTTSEVCTATCTRTITLPPGNYSWRINTYGPGTIGINYSPSSIRTLAVLE
ncbi:MAG: S8 family serine peptidase [Aggregatilineales bacterium]